MSQNNNNTNTKHSVVGVDFGSSCFKMAAIEKGAVEVITNEANFRQTPNIVGYGDQERVIGEAGYNRIKSNFSNTIVAPQRFLKKNDAEYLQEQSKFCPCKIQTQPHSVAFKVKAHGKQETVLPEQATAACLTKMDEIIGINSLNAKNLTLSVPNYMNEQERNSIMKAVQIKDPSYPVQLVNESTAVGMDYGFYKKNQFPEKEEQGKNVLFIDFGHSKLSLYILKFTKSYMKTVYENHSRQLGCKNLDYKIFEFYSQLFEQENQDLTIKVSESKKATLKLLEAIEKQRKILSGICECDFGIECLLDGCDISYSMKREKFQEISGEVISLIRKFLNENKDEILKRNVNVSAIELIGGGSRIPFFGSLVQQIYGLDPSRTLNSSQCVARGATLISAMNSVIFKMQPFYSVDIANEPLRLYFLEENTQNVFEAEIYQKEDSLFSKKEVKVNIPNRAARYTVMVAGSQNIAQFSLQTREIQTDKETIELALQYEIDQSLMFKSLSLIDTSKGKLQLVKIFEQLDNETILKFREIERKQMEEDERIFQYYEQKNQLQSSIYKSKEKADQIASGFIPEASLNSFKQMVQELEETLELNEKMDLKQARSKLKAQLDQIIATSQRNMARFNDSQKSLSRLSEYVSLILGGKIKGLEGCPEMATQVQDWINQVTEQQNSQNKWEEPACTSIEANRVFDQLKRQVDSSVVEQQNRRRAEQQQRNRNSYGQQQRNNYHPRFLDGNATRRNRMNSNPFGGFFNGF